MDVKNKNMLEYNFYNDFFYVNMNFENSILNEFFMMDKEDNISSYMPYEEAIKQ